MSDSVQAIIDRASDRTPDELVICAREGMASYWLARYLPDLLQLQPNVKLFIKVMPTTPNLAEGDGDIAIQYEKPTAANVISRQLGWLHYILYAAPDYLARHGEPKTLSDLQAHQCLRLVGEAYQPECWQKGAAAWGTILPHAMATDASTVLVEACAAGAGIAIMPSYVSEFENRLTPLTDIKPLATVRFWLAYTERVRNMEASQPVLHWIRSCFDPSRRPCFREIYVPPQRRSRVDHIANDVVPGVSARDNAGSALSVLPEHLSVSDDAFGAKRRRVESKTKRTSDAVDEGVGRLIASGQGNRVTTRTAVEKR